MSTAFGSFDHPIAKDTFSDTTLMTNTARRLLADIRELAVPSSVPRPSPQRRGKLPALISGSTLRFVKRLVLVGG